MKITGFSFVRNAIKYDYPIVEAVKSILPLCDDFVIAVGKSDDDTLSLVRSIAPDKVRIVETVWNDDLRTGGKVLADETNKAFRAIADDTDWCFYIQADEIIHERYHDEIRRGMQRWKDDEDVDGLLFKYLHFYGSYDYVGTSTQWYPREIRVVKNDKRIYSYRDAQGFRIGDDEKLKVKELNAYVHHYGWVKDPRTMQQKKETFSRLWHNDQYIQEKIAGKEHFNYAQHIDALEKFKGTHPQVIQERIDSRNWKFDYDTSFNRLTLKERVKQFAEQKLGLNLSYRNYKVI
ncbi:MAG: glycosyltransferase family 2 protein [Chitinophagales bacterium]|nr:glycosyltransferase family 2 protein [Chitinophagaceae bacterium]MCB9063967.1 glycosyltransferase family 2 protein [Chitinophagales bacterium]